MFHDMFVHVRNRTICKFVCLCLFISPDMFHDMFVGLRRVFTFFLTLLSFIRHRIRNRLIACLTCPSDAFQLTTANEPNGERPGLQSAGPTKEREGKETNNRNSNKPKQ